MFLQASAPSCYEEKEGGCAMRLLLSRSCYYEVNWMGMTGRPFVCTPQHQCHMAKKIIGRNSRMMLIIDSDSIIRRLGWLPIFLPVMSKIINSKQSGPKI